MRALSFIIGVVLLILYCGCRREILVEPQEVGPTIEFVSPDENAMILDSAIVEVQVSSPQPVTRVVISIDGLIKSDQIFFAPPYKFDWLTDTLQEASSHELFAAVYLNDERVFGSKPRRVTAYHLAPSNLIARLVYDTLITLTWEDNSDKETSYQLEWSINHLLFALLQQLPANVTSTFVSGNHANSDTLAFRVCALRDSFRSRYSNVAIVTFGLPPNSHHLLHRR